jgi:hypothetical protein
MGEYLRALQALCFLKELKSDFIFAEPEFVLARPPFVPS